MPSIQQQKLNSNNRVMTSKSNEINMKCQSLSDLAPTLEQRYSRRGRRERQTATGLCPLVHTLRCARAPFYIPQAYNNNILNS